jgi:hypothetical protein
MMRTGRIVIEGAWAHPLIGVEYEWGEYLGWGKKKKKRPGSDP